MYINAAFRLMSAASCLQCNVCHLEPAAFLSILLSDAFYLLFDACCLMPAA